MWHHLVEITWRTPETDEEDVEYHETFNITSSGVCRESSVLAMHAIVKKLSQLRTTYQNLLLVEKCSAYTVLLM